MGFIGALGILLGTFIIVYFSLKGVNMIMTAPLATLAVVLFNQLPVVETLLGKEATNYMGSLGTYLMNYFAIFLLGSILAKLMESSGATTSIANFILDKVGKDNPFRVLLAVFLISAVLTYGGISLFVVMFAIIPLARTLFEKVDLSWHLIQVPVWLGIATFTMTMLPGTTAIQNVIPIKYLNTSLTAAAIPSLFGSVGCVAFGLLYMNRCLKKSLKAGETFGTYTEVTKLDEITVGADKKIPSFLASVTPLVLLVTLSILGSLFGNTFMKSNVIYLALIVGIVTAVVLFYPYIEDKKMVFNKGAVESINPIMTTASAVAFGSIVVLAPGFKFFSEIIFHLPGSPLISLTALTSFIAGITGSSSGAVGIVMPTYAQQYLDMGIHPEVLHRVTSVASNILTLPPQSGALITFVGLTGLGYKNGFKQSFVTVFGGSLVAVIIIILTSQLFY